MGPLFSGENLRRLTNPFAAATGWSCPMNDSQRPTRSRSGGVLGDQRTSGVWEGKGEGGGDPHSENYDSRTDLSLGSGDVGESCPPSPVWSVCSVAVLHYAVHVCSFEFYTNTYVRTVPSSSLVFNAVHLSAGGPEPRAEVSIASGPEPEHSSMYLRQSPFVLGSLRTSRHVVYQNKS
jgi:hypothetical protein